jgi:hypothetical protein
MNVMRGADRLTLEVHGDRDLDVRVAAVLTLALRRFGSEVSCPGAN